MFNLDKSKIDWAIFFPVSLLLAFSLLAVYSATAGSESSVLRGSFERQFVWILIGIAIAIVITFLPSKLFFSFSYPAYAVLIGMLLLLELMGPTGPTSRWFELGAIKIQPSEFMKPVLVLAMARYFTEEDRNPNDMNHLFVAFMMVLLPFLLVIKQPDLGTALTFLIVPIPMLYWRGLSPFAIFVICAPVVTFIASFNFYSFFLIMAVISLILLWSRRGILIFASVFVINVLVGAIAPQIWNHLHPYQQNRILTFLGLISDPQGAGYQIIQSKVAIGSGGLFGKGLLQGTQTQLRFLPAQHTDFIFSVLAEEWGFIGSLLLISLFFILIIRSIYISASTKHQFDSMVVIGLVSMIGFQVIINIGMTVGVMPVTGLPLPLVSYGGSSMITSMVIVGLIANASKNRYHLFR